MSIDSLDELLIAADPVRNRVHLSTSALNALRDELVTMTTVPTRRSRRPSRRAAAALVAAVVIGAGATGAAAAGGLFARTGIFGSGGEEGHSELIKLDASDAAGVIQDLSVGIPLPPGGTFSRATATLASNAALTPEDGIRNTLAWNAACQWATYWLDGDNAQRAQAQTTLDEIPDWTVLTANNPDGGVRLMWQHIAEAARAGDAEQLRSAGYIANCTSATVADR